MVPTSTPYCAFSTMSAVSVTFRAATVPPIKSSAPGQSMKLSFRSCHSTLKTVENTEYPYSFSTGK